MDIDLDLSYNNVTASAMRQILQDFDNTEPQVPKPRLNINFSHNNVTMLPACLFGVSANYGLRKGVAIDVTYNPITSVSPDMFLFSGKNGNIRNVLYTTPPFAQLSVDISHATNGPVVFPDTPFQIAKSSFDPESVVTFQAANTGVTDASTVLNMFQNFLVPQPQGCGSDCRVNVGLAHNHISRIDSGSLHNGVVSAIDLSSQKDGGLTYIAADAFPYTFLLTSLLLSNNSLTFLSSDLLANMPALSALTVDANPIHAMPIQNNHIVSAQGIEMQCSSFGPIIHEGDCQCPQGNLSFLCGYVRCVTLQDGCPPDTELNRSNCSMAPFSACVAPDAAKGQYYDSDLQSFLPYTVCATAYPLRKDNDPNITYLSSWQYAAGTSTTDRRCAICSMCPSGYVQTPPLSWLWCALVCVHVCVCVA